MSDGTPQNKQLYSFAFYNLENLFDTVNDPATWDDDYATGARLQWNEKRFKKKVKKLGWAISRLGRAETGFPPAVVGVAEVENAYVMKALCASKKLKKKYGYVHFDSPDERGIDTGLLYRKEVFTVTNTETVPLYLENQYGQRDFTRDTLHVTGSLKNQTVHILVNHWPSRREGAKKTAHKRLAAAHANRKIIATIKAGNENAKIIVMGDFNDNPKSDSIHTLKGTDLYNPMEMAHTHGTGSLSHRGQRDMFDQILVSNSFLAMHDNPFRFEGAKVFNPDTLKVYKGRFKGLPFRTFAGPRYLGGFSDHFPVYALFSVAVQ